MVVKELIEIILVIHLRQMEESEYVFFFFSVVILRTSVGVLDTWQGQIVMPSSEGGGTER